MKPLSPIDANFLIAERRTMPMHVGGLLLFSYPKDADESWLHTTISDAKESRDVQAPFNQKLAFPRSRLGYPHWTTDHGFDLDYHVRHSALPKPGRYRELFALLSRLHSTRLHRDRPLWECHIIEGIENNHFAMYSKQHHSMMDGVGGMRMLLHSMSSDPDERGMRPAWALKPPKPSAGDARRKVEQSLWATMSGATRGAARFFQMARETDDHGLMGPFQSPETILNQKISGSRRFVAQSYSLPRIKAIGKALGATVNDVVLAMTAGALRHYLRELNAMPARSLTAMTPVSFRAADGGAQGNSFSAAIASLATDIDDPLERLRIIRHSMGLGKEMLGSLKKVEIPLYTTLISLPTAIPALLRFAGHGKPPFNVTVSNVPGPKEQVYWNGARLEGMYPLSILADGLALNITLTSCADSLDFGILACRRTVPGAQRLIDHLETALVELEKAYAESDRQVTSGNGAGKLRV